MAEHQRPDRDQHIRILWENIAQGNPPNFSLDFSDATPQDPYDYGSIMHYGPYTSSKNGNPTMETFPIGIPIGEANVLSRQDQYGVHELYGAPITQWTTITVNPGWRGVTMEIDGEPYHGAPESFRWPYGSVHTIRALDTESDTGSLRFQKWSHGEEGRSFELVVGEDSPKVMTAHYARYFKLDSGAYEDRGGRVVVAPYSPDGYYPQRTPIVAIAVPNPGWSFATWSGSVYARRHGFSGNPAYFHIGSDGVNYEAWFTTIPLVRIETNHPGAHILVDGRDAWLPTALSGMAGRRYTLELPDRTQYGPRQDLTRWVFKEWSNCSSACTSSTLRITGLGRTKSYGAYFTQQHSLRLYSDPPEAGFLDSIPHSPDGFYDSGSAVHLKATPRGELPFQGWLRQTPFGAQVNTDNPAVMVIDEPSLVEGIFF